MQLQSHYLASASAAIPISIPPNANAMTLAVLVLLDALLSRCCQSNEPGADICCEKNSHGRIGLSMLEQALPHWAHRPTCFCLCLNQVNMIQQLNCMAEPGERRWRLSVDCNAVRLAAHMQAVAPLDACKFWSGNKVASQTPSAPPMGQRWTCICQLGSPASSAPRQALANLSAAGTECPAARHGNSVNIYC
jgi:hypothetical protein